LSAKPLSTTGREAADNPDEAKAAPKSSRAKASKRVAASDTDGPETEASPKRRAIPWAEIKSTYEESALPVSVIAKAYAVRERAVYERAAREAWVTRRTQAAMPPPERVLDRAVLISRLFHAVERQIAEIERRFAELAGSGADERDARTLAALARTIELLIGLERQAKPESLEAPEVDIDEIRRDLARRIANMRRDWPD
jgi:hypothetical protein